LAGLADVSFLFVLSFSRGTRYLGRLHVGTVTKLTLFVHEVCIVCGVGTCSELVVVPYYVIVGRGGCCQTQVVLVLNSTSDTEPLSTHLCRVETRIESELCRGICETLACLIWQNLVDLLLVLDTKLVAWSCLWWSLPWGWLAWSFARTSFRLLWHRVLHQWSRLALVVLIRGCLRDNDIRIFYNEIVAW